ncbi:MAG TPA: DUF1206 domain-containing protein [Gemmatimonadales bacterium]|nr:DUF1206 domain-containing protein [Gemmatimonadales bacterium]
MRPTPTWVERLARVGIVAKAVVYLAIGTLATGVALRAGGVLTGGEGVLRLLVTQPMGRGLLAALGFGFAAYTLWLFAQAVVDPDGNGTSVVGLANRVGQIITGIAHLALDPARHRWRGALPLHPFRLSSRTIASSSAERVCSVAGETSPLASASIIVPAA